MLLSSSLPFTFESYTVYVCRHTVKREKGPINDTCCAEEVQSCTTTTNNNDLIGLLVIDSDPTELISFLRRGTTRRDTLPRLLSLLDRIGYNNIVQQL